jgi:hypothetical protein
MIHRPLWLAAGAAVGVSATLYAQHKVKRQVAATVERFTPERLLSEARGSARDFADRFSAALSEGRQTRARTEAELWEGLGERRTSAKVVTGR